MGTARWGWSGWEREVWGREVWGPEGWGPEAWGPEGCDPKGMGPKGRDPEGWVGPPKGGTPEGWATFSRFSLSRLSFHSFFPLGGLLVEFCCLKRRDRGVLRLSCEAPAATKPREKEKKKKRNLGGPAEGVWGRGFRGRGVQSRWSGAWRVRGLARVGLTRPNTDTWPKTPSWPMRHRPVDDTRKSTTHTSWSVSHPSSTCTPHTSIWHKEDVPCSINSRGHVRLPPVRSFTVCRVDFVFFLARG